MPLASILFLTLGWLGRYVEKPLRQWMWLILVLSLACGSGFGATYLDGDVTSYKAIQFLVIALCCTIPVSIASDFFFIVLTRWILGRAARSDSFGRIMVLLIGDALLAACLILLPLFAFSVTSAADYSGPEEMSYACWLTALSNAIDGFVASSCFLLAITMLLYRILWPVVERPLYAAHRFRITKQKKLCFFIGLALVRVAFPAFAKKVEVILKQIHLLS
jgi:hypothetical protein